MRTKNRMRHLAWGVLGLVTQQGFSQVTQDNNNGGFGSFVGWNAGANQVLEVKNEANQPIDWYTNAIQRMRLNPTQNNTINGFSVPTDGFLSLGPNALATNTAPLVPWTRLHLHDNVTTGNAVQNGYRDWMRNGVTMTGHGDQMYVGHKYGTGLSDPTDAIFQWSDNSGTQNGPDLMRFVFTAA